MMEADDVRFGERTGPEQVEVRRVRTAGADDDRRRGDGDDRGRGGQPVLDALKLAVLLLLIVLLRVLVLCGQLLDRGGTALLDRLERGLHPRPSAARPGTFDTRAETDA